MSEERAKLVYSTGKSLPRKGRPAKDSVRPALDPSHQKVIVRLDRKQRGGKSVTVIEGLLLRAKDKEALLKRLKAALGAGGAVRDSALEIQGNHCKAIIAALHDIGFRPKRSGS